LVVKEATVGEGPTLKRIMPRARGSASRILKRTSHIRIVLSDEIVIETRETRKGEATSRKEERQRRTLPAKRHRVRQPCRIKNQRSRSGLRRRRNGKFMDKKLIQLGSA